MDRRAWNALLASQTAATPFLRHEYLCALHQTGCATAQTGWTPRLVLLEKAGKLRGACAVYLKSHSRGEYVFDWAWANAYAQHGLSYYPKAVSAVPFTPVPGVRLMAMTEPDRTALARALVSWAAQEQLSSLHILFADTADMAACVAAGMMQRHTVQFHWNNSEPGYRDFDHFLASLAQEKRKKIRQERRKVAEAGVRFRWATGRDISDADWHFFYQCYERTYLEHGNAPYLSRGFFQLMAQTMPEHWLLFIAERDGRAIATSLIALNQGLTGATDLFGTEKSSGVAYGRYWGAMERVDCLHFEACYYQPLEWCIQQGWSRFEGGAQGEHKMARALLPVMTSSAHWIAHPAFANAVDDFLAREGEGVHAYLGELQERSPLRKAPVLTLE